MSNIIINEENFKKIATKVNQRWAVHMVETLGDKYPELHVDECTAKHTNSLNLLAEAMGFKNYHAIQVFFNKNTSKEISHDWQEQFFLSMGDHLLSSFIMYSIVDDSTTNDMWVKRALTLLNVSVALFYYRIKNEKNFQATSQNLEDCFELQVLNEYLNKNNLDKKTQSLIQSYLFSLPGWSMQPSTFENIHNTVREQHGYLRMQFINILSVLHRLDYSLILLTKDLFAKTNINNDLIEYFELFKPNRDNIVYYFKESNILSLRDILILYKLAPSVQKRKSILNILQFSVENLDIVKLLVPQK